MIWSRGIENLSDKFMALPSNERKSIIDQIINVNGLRAPRLKSWKAMDKENYGKANAGSRTYQTALFEVVASKHIVNKAA